MSSIYFKSTKLFITLIVCSAFFHSVPVFGQKLCRALFDTPLDIAQEAWHPSKFTSVENFNPQHFRLIVHAAANITATGVEPVAAFMNTLALRDFNQAQLFSASIISELHTATFSRAGVILDVPNEKMVAATSDDMRSHVRADFTNEEAQASADNLFKREGLVSPELILEKASHDTGFFNSDFSWTEVVVAGPAKASRPIRIVGLFSHQDSVGNILLADPQAEVVQKTSKEMGLPLILLPPPKGELVLKARFRGAQRIGYEDWGPQEIDFFASSTEVSKIFETARKTGKNVRLVNESRGLPGTLLASPGFLEGEWIHKVYAQDGGYSSQLVTFKPNQLPAGLSPIKFGFLR
jgi:hypothetical protein